VCLGIEGDRRFIVDRQGMHFDGRTMECIDLTSIEVKNDVMLIGKDRQLRIPTGAAPREDRERLRSFLLCRQAQALGTHTEQQDAHAARAALTALAPPER